LSMKSRANRVTRASLAVAGACLSSSLAWAGSAATDDGFESEFDAPKGVGEARESQDVTVQVLRSEAAGTVWEQTLVGYLETLVAKDCDAENADAASPAEAVAKDVGIDERFADDPSDIGKVIDTVAGEAKKPVAEVDPDWDLAEPVVTVAETNADWDLEEPTVVAASVDADWDIEEPVVVAVEADWDIEEPAVIAAFDADWDLAEPVVVAADVDWDIDEPAVVAIDDADWDLEEGVAVVAGFDADWDLAEPTVAAVSAEETNIATQQDPLELFP